MSENKEVITENYSLNDDRRVKVLSPGALVAKRFFRNRLAVFGLSILIFMFLFSFVGGLVSPYDEKQTFYREDFQNKEFAGVVINDEFRYAAAPEKDFGGVLNAQAYLAISSGQSEFIYKAVKYTVTNHGEDFYSFYTDGELIGIAYKDIVNMSDANETIDFDFMFASLAAKSANEKSFEYKGETYTIDKDDGVFKNGTEVAYISRFIARPILPDVFLTRDFKQQLELAIETKDDEFTFTDTDGTVAEYTLKYNAGDNNWSVMQSMATRVLDTYSAPSKSHWLGTDKSGMDMLTRIMYGGRVSLIIGFIVVIIETVIGVVLGGLAGYFGKWVDMLIMRIVDVFYCIPSMPIMLIIGAAMDEYNVDPQIRMLYLMLILGFLGWPGIARLVRGQILSLREQEFMIAAEASGISVPRRIFKHLLPNVIPQLIVTMTMGIGSTIITESTLSFLGLGVRFPFASWGNIINDVTDVHVLTSYWFVWIPAGVCLLVTVLAYNLVGDGLRDAFDPKMKR
ncbi:MAG TPA: ABC transporter permease [Clostridiales bacterium]|nr:ABC transporter permease [Clostridiales bacterium]